jgi:hypothetical protein
MSSVDVVVYSPCAECCSGRASNRAQGLERSIGSFPWRTPVRILNTIFRTAQSFYYKISKEESRQIMTSRWHRYRTRPRSTTQKMLSTKTLEFGHIQTWAVRSCEFWNSRIELQVTYCLSIHISTSVRNFGWILQSVVFAIVPLYCGRVVVKALCYKPEGRGFETRGGEFFLSIHLILPAALGPEVYLASNRNEYQKHKNNVSGE